MRVSVPLPLNPGRVEGIVVSTFASNDSIAGVFLEFDTHTSLPDPSNNPIVAVADGIWRVQPGFGYRLDSAVAIDGSSNLGLLEYQWESSATQGGSYTGFGITAVVAVGNNARQFSDQPVAKTILLPSTVTFLRVGVVTETAIDFALATGSYAWLEAQS